MKRVSKYVLLSLTAVAIGGCLRPTAGTETQDVSARIATLSPQILGADCRTDVAYIASDACEGRLTGSPGAHRAAEYIAAAFRQAGLQPSFAKSDYFQPFDFTVGVRIVPGKNTMDFDATAAKPDGGGDAGAAPAAPPQHQTCKLDADFRPLPFSANGAADGELVFVGYGVVEPQSKGQGYDAYAGLDVMGKVVVALNYLPENLTPQRRQELSLYADDRYKAKIAADRGAVGFLLVAGPNSPNAGRLVKIHPDDSVSSGPIVAASISGELAEQILKRGGLDDLKTLQTGCDGETVNPHMKRSLSGVRVNLAVELERPHQTCRNVVGILPPTGGVDEYLIVGAHYDHIGHGIGRGSLAHQGEEGQVHNGADDNASGVAAVLELAGALSEARRTAPASQPQRGVIFGCWSGEELGILGSSHYAADPAVPLDKTVAYFNFDMVGRLRADKLIVQSVGSSPDWPGLIDRCNEAARLQLTKQEDPYLPTDATAFYTKGVPALAFFTGSHEDYDRPTDDPETLNYDGLQRVATFARCLIERILPPDAKVAYARVAPTSPQGSRGGARAYTGTVPDFAGGDVKGVRLADIRPGGPAEKAGLRAGDVIVEFAGRKVANLQDYQDALVGAKPGQPVEVAVERGGEKLTFTITPTTRPE